MDEVKKQQIATRNLVLFVIGKLMATLGSSVYAFAISLYILKVTGSAMNFSISLLCSTLPRVLLGPISGVISDRYDRKRVIVSADFISAFIAAGLFLVFTNISNELIVLYVASILLNTVSTFYGTAITSAIPNMVAKDQIQKASSINQSIVSLSGMLGPVIGGFLFAFVSLPTFMIINACTFFISACTALVIRYDLYLEEKKDGSEEKMPVLDSLKDGFVYVKNHRFLGPLILFAFILNFFFAAFAVYLPYISVTIREISSDKFGFIEGAIACGTFIAAIIMSSRKEIQNKNKFVFIGLTMMGVCMAMVGFAAGDLFGSVNEMITFSYLAAICFGLGCMMMVVNIPIFVILQKETPDEYRGRVMGFLETGASAITPLGFIIFGAIVSYVSPLYILVIIGVVQIALAIYYFKNNIIQLDLTEKLEI
ncbi:MAG: MFS transporter [Bacillaceae bacterium]